MKLLTPIFVLALAVGFSASCTQLEIDDNIAGLTASPSAQKIAKDGTASVTFSFSFKSESGVPRDLSRFTATIAFEATGGSVSPASATTDKNGNVTVVFTTPDPNSFTGGTVKGVVKKVQENKADGLFQQGDLANATATILPLDAEPEPGDGTVLDKARKLGMNTYVLQKSGGEPVTYTYVQKYSDWRVYTNENGSKDVSLSLEDADDDGRTRGMFWGHFPLSTIGSNTVITKEFLKNNPHFKMGFERGVPVSGSGNEWLSAGAYGGKEADFSRIKTNGNSRYLIKEGTATKADWHGTYEVLFYLEFVNMVEDPATGNYVEGDTYVAYGRAEANEHVPSITSFQLKVGQDWVKVGESVEVVLDHYYEEEATWDWNDVLLVGSSTDYSGVTTDEGFFSWDAAAHTLKCLKSNNNERVLLMFTLKSNSTVKDYVYLAAGEGWKYTSFELGPAEQTVYPGSRCSFSVRNWTPRDSEDESFDVTGIELDPASDPNGDFAFYNSGIYAQYGGILDHYKSSNPTFGEHTLKFRLKSDHHVTATMKVAVVQPE